MSVKSVKDVRVLAAVPYRIVRVPVAIAEFKVVQRLPADSWPRQVFEQTVRRVDHLAGLLLGDRTIGLISGPDRARTTTPDSAPVEPEHSPQPAPEPTPDPAPEPAPAPAPAPPKAERATKSASSSRAKTTPSAGTPAPGARARARVTKAEQHNDSRSNRSLASIKQGLLQTEAVAEAREHRAEEKAADPAPNDPDGSASD